MSLPTRRRLRLPRPTLADRGVVAVVALLCALITVGAAGASAWLRVTADDMAAQVFEDALYPARQLQVFYAEVHDTEVPQGAGAEVARSLPPSLDRLVEDPRHAVVLAEGVPHALPRDGGDSPAFLSVVGFPDARDLVHVVDGRFPRPGSEEEVLPAAVAADFDGPRRTPVVEVALERRTARALRLEVGSYVNLTSRGYRRPDDEAPVLRVAGLYEPSAAYPSPLDDVDNARRPAISTLPEFTMVRGAALAADDSTVLGAPWAAYPEVRWTFDADGTPTAAEAEAVVPEARRLSVQAWPPVLDSGPSSAGTGIGDLAATFVAARDASDTMSALVLAALAAAALALLLAAASVLEARRREVTDVLRARGAPTTHLAALRAGEALLVVAPGLLGAVVLTATTTMLPRDLAPAAVAATGCVALLTLTQVAPSSTLPERVRLALRDALQIVAVALAVGGSALMLWRQRVDAGDPLLLALPALVGVAATVLALRGARWLTAVTRTLAARGRSLAPMVGASQAGTAVQHVMVPVLGVTLSATCALLAVSVDDTVHRGVERSAWAEVGADVQVSGGFFDETFVQRVEDLPGVATVAAVHTANGVLQTRIGPKQVPVVALDPADLARVTRDAPDPARLRFPDGDRVGVVASTGIDVDERSTLDYAQATVPVRVVGHVAELPGITDGDVFVVVQEKPFRAAVDREHPTYETLLIDGRPDRKALRDLVDEAAPLARIRTRDGVARRALDSAVAGRTLLLSRAAGALSVLLALLAAGLAVATGRPLRRRTLAVLHALGVDRRQARWLNAWELVPAMAGAALAACGGVLLLTLAAGHGIDLSVLTGSTDDLAFGPAPVSWLAAALALAALVALVATASAVQGRGQDARIPDEEAR